MEKIIAKDFDFNNWADIILRQTKMGQNPCGDFSSI